MNKIIIILGVLSGWLTFAGCEGPTVGYLITEDVSYPIDTIRVMSYSRLLQEVTNLEEQKIHYDQTEEGKVLVNLKAELARLEEKYDYLSFQMDSLKDLMYEAEDAGNQDEANRLEDLRQEKRIERNKIGWELDDLDMEIAPLEKIKEETVGNIDDELVLTRRRITDTIPWTSSPIDGVAGTEPLIYSIERIKGDDVGKTAIFSKYLTIMGGGRFVLYWSKEEQLPAGVYTVTIRITNEGYSRTFDNVMTYIVE